MQFVSISDAFTIKKFTQLFERLPLLIEVILHQFWCLGALMLSSLATTTLPSNACHPISLSATRRWSKTPSWTE